MTRVITMALAAAAMSLSTGSVAHAETLETVEFNFTWAGDFNPINSPGLESWSMNYTTDLLVDDTSGAFHPPGEGSYAIVFYLDIGDQHIPVEITDHGDYYAGGTGAFNMNTEIADVPGYGAMFIDVTGNGTYEDFRWSGTAEITWGPGLPFAGTVTQSGEWSAQIVPAPGAIALFGLAGLSGRRRRD